MAAGANSFVNRALEVPCLSAIHMTLVFGQVALSISCLATRSCALRAQPVVPREQLLVFAELWHPVPSVPPRKSHTGTVPISADTRVPHTTNVPCVPLLHWPFQLLHWPFQLLHWSSLKV